MTGHGIRPDSCESSYGEIVSHRFMSAQNRRAGEVRESSSALRRGEMADCLRAAHKVCVTYRNSSASDVDP
jgi:hypothetical protein